MIQINGLIIHKCDLFKCHLAKIISISREQDIHRPITK